jgi:hypothetical protein
MPHNVGHAEETTLQDRSQPLQVRRQQIGTARLEFPGGQKEVIDPRLALEQGPDRRLVRDIGDDWLHPPASQANLFGDGKAFDRSPESVFGSTRDGDGCPRGQRQLGRLQADPRTAADNNQMLTLKSHGRLLKRLFAFRCFSFAGQFAQQPDQGE